MPDNSLLTVTVLEAQLKVDLSNFLQKMTIYAVVTLGGEPRKSELQKGSSVKFKQASFAYRTNSQDHLIEMQIFACNLLVPDSSIGGAILKV